MLVLCIPGADIAIRIGQSVKRYRTETHLAGIHDEVVIRTVREADRGALREICRQTGLSGDPVWLYFEDADVLTAIFVDYYVDHEPDTFFVAEVDGRVVGYQLVCPDTRRKRRIMMKSVYPRLVFRVAWKVITGQYRDPATYHSLRWFITRSFRERFSIPLDDYPVHGHFNVKAEFRNRGIGRLLGNAAVAHCVEHDFGGNHIIIREPEGEERLSRFYAEKRHYQVLEKRRFTLWDRPTGKRWYARLMVRDTAARDRVDIGR
jgi:GNAT superfamily N-acetyltransferase